MMFHKLNEKTTVQINGCPTKVTIVSLLPHTFEVIVHCNRGLFRVSDISDRNFPPNYASGCTDMSDCAFDETINLSDDCDITIVSDGFAGRIGIVRNKKKVYEWECDHQIASRFESLFNDIIDTIEYQGVADLVDIINDSLNLIKRILNCDRVFCNTNTDIRELNYSV